MTFFKSNYKQLFICLFFAAVCFQAMPLLANGQGENHTIEHVVQEQLTTPPNVMPSSIVVEQKVAAEGQVALAEPLTTYRVGPDDEVKITVFGENDLTGTYPVNGNGFISMPLIGDIQVKDFSLKEIEAAIVARLKDGYLLDPRVSIEISKYRPFYILGEVRAPGSYGYVNNMSVLNAVALAGGFTYRANKKYVHIMRTQEDGQINEKLPVDTNVLPGDIILVKERFF